METVDSVKAKGNACMASKDFEGAVNWYSKGIEMDPSNHVLYSNRSAAYLSAGKGEEALKDADKCVELNGTWPTGYCRKGAALQFLRRYKDAVSAFEEGCLFHSLLTCRPEEVRS